MDEYDGPRRLASLRLRNFLSVGDDPVEIRFGRRLTLLYGSNGAGKSTIIRALGVLNDVAGLDTRLSDDLRHGLDPSRACELIARFEGTSRPATDGTVVHVPIEEVTLRWAAPYQAAAASGDAPEETNESVLPVTGGDYDRLTEVGIRYAGGTLRRWADLSGGGLLEVELSTGEPREGATPPDLSGALEAKMLAGDLHSSDGAVALHAALVLGDIGEVTTFSHKDSVGLDWESSNKQPSTLWTRSFIEQYVPLSGSGTPQIPDEIDMVLPFKDTLAILWSSVLPEAPSLEVSAWAIDSEEATRRETARRDAEWEANKGKHTNGGRYYSAEDEAREGYAVVQCTWKLSSGATIPLEALSSGERRVAELLVAVVSSRLTTIQGFVPSGPVVFEEPEVGLHSRTQGALLRALLRLDAVAQESFEARRQDTETWVSELAAWPYRVERFPDGLRPLIIETHSEAFLRAALDLVEQGRLDPEAGIAIHVLDKVDGCTTAHEMPVSAGGSLLRLWPGPYPGGASGASE